MYNKARGPILLTYDLTTSLVANELIQDDLVLEVRQVLEVLSHECTPVKLFKIKVFGTFRFDLIFQGDN
jgi:hypothetical protein